MNKNFSLSKEKLLDYYNKLKLDLSVNELSELLRQDTFCIESDEIRSIILAEILHKLFKKD